MSFDTERANVTQEFLGAIADAKRSPERSGASEYGPGPSRNRSEVAPLVNRDHRRAAVAVPIPVTSNRPLAGRDIAHLKD